MTNQDLEALDTVGPWLVGRRVAFQHHHQPIVDEQDETSAVSESLDVGEHVAELRASGSVQSPDVGGMPELREKADARELALRHMEAGALEPQAFEHR